MLLSILGALGFVMMPLADFCGGQIYKAGKLVKQIVLQNCYFISLFLIFVTGRWFCSCVFPLAWFCFHRNVLYLDNTGECHQKRPAAGGGGRGGHEPERDGEDRR